MFKKVIAADGSFSPPTLFLLPYSPQRGCSVRRAALAAKISRQPVVWEPRGAGVPFWNEIVPFRSTGGSGKIFPDLFRQDYKSRQKPTAFSIYFFLFLPCRHRTRVK